MTEPKHRLTRMKRWDRWMLRLSMFFASAMSPPIREVHFMVQDAGRAAIVGIQESEINAAVTWDTGDGEIMVSTMEYWVTETGETW